MVDEFEPLKRQIDNASTCTTALSACGCMRSRIWRVLDPGAAQSLQSCQRYHELELSQSPAQAYSHCARLTGKRNTLHGLDLSKNERVKDFNKAIACQG